MPDAEQLNIDPALIFDGLLIVLASLIIGLNTAREIHPILGDIHMVEKIEVHEVPVALLVLDRKVTIFVEVESGQVAKRDLPIRSILHKAGIEPLRGGSCSQTQNARRVLLDMLSENIRSASGHFVVVFFDDELQ